MKKEYLTSEIQCTNTHTHTLKVGDTRRKLRRTVMKTDFME